MRKLMLWLGADKGLHGVGLFMSEPSDVVTKSPIRTLADFKGKKIRIFASQFQSVAFERLGVTPVAMSLGDVLPAIQQGAIDGAVTGMGPITHMHFIDAAKFVTMTNQPSIFIIAEVNRKWYESLPKDLQEIIDRDGAAQSLAIVPIAASFRAKAEANYRRPAARKSSSRRTNRPCSTRRCPASVRTSRNQVRSLPKAIRS